MTLFNGDIRAQIWSKQQSDHESSQLNVTPRIEMEQFANSFPTSDPRVPKVTCQLPSLLSNGPLNIRRILVPLVATQSISKQVT